MQGTTEIFWGETIEIAGAPKTAEGVPMVLDASWSASCAITKTRIGGEVIASPPIEIISGVPQGTIDTGDKPWEPGVYYYDICVTGPDGRDYWSEPGRIILRNRNSRAS
jgi:hypothetical protein